MRTLLDTCILAEIRKPDGSPAVKSAVSKLDDRDIYLSVVSLVEIGRGIHLLPNGKKKKTLASWLEGLRQNFADRILPIDHEVALIWGEMTATAQKGGEVIPGVDGLIAATALRHGLHVMTRNVRHFRASRANIIDPWSNDRASFTSDQK
jgi:predicted nucleic acid-binding protein